jgi:hypothetical protein
MGAHSMKLNFVSAAVVATLALAGCSGGGPTTSGTGSGSGECTSNCGGTTTPGSVAVALSSNTVTSAAPATVTATVLDGNSQPVSGAVVNFAVNPAIGSLSASAALTDASGVASVTLSPATSTTSGADNVSVSVTVGSNTVTAARGYQINATTAQFSSLTSNTGTTSADALAAYGQAVLTAKMTGVTAAAPVTVAVTSTCVAAGKATISPSTVTDSSGTVAFTYKDTGCGATMAADTITTSISGTSTSISSQLYLTSPVANSLAFNAATPSTIFLKGSGNVESSTVTFKVVDTAGNPLPGQHVTLTLSSYAGGVTLDQKDESELASSPDVQVSDSNGLVSGIVNSGTVPTPVRVIAKLPSGVSTVSSNLAIVTGLPSQMNFSMSQGTINIEGATRDGTSNTYTIYAADRSGNPVPDGTTILFWAEGGQIEGTKSTALVNGLATTTAQFVSADPRPADGRVTVLAYAIGEESFVDTTGTNVWSTGEAFQDLGNVVKNKLFDGIYDPANDEVVSLSALGSGAGGKACVSYAGTHPEFALNNTIPNQPNTCDATWTGKTYVRRATETVFSTSNANPMVRKTVLNDGGGVNGECKSILIYETPPTLGPQVAEYPLGAPGNSNLYVGAGTSGSFDFRYSDANTVRLNPMPAGTKITATSADPTNGLSSVSVGPVNSFTVPSTADANWVPLSYVFASPNGILSNVGGLTLSFTSPAGLVTSAFVTLNRANPPTPCP